MAESISRNAQRVQSYSLNKEKAEEGLECTNCKRNGYKNLYMCKPSLHFCCAKSIDGTTVEGFKDELRRINKKFEGKQIMFKMVPDENPECKAEGCKDVLTGYIVYSYVEGKENNGDYYHPCCAWKRKGDCQCNANTPANIECSKSTTPPKRTKNMPENA